MPRAVKSRMSAPQGTPASGAVSALGGDGGADGPHPRVLRVGLPRREGAARPGEPDRRVLGVGGVHRGLERAPRASAGSSPTRTPTRPSKTSRSGTELDHSPACTRPTLIG